MYTLFLFLFMGAVALAGGFAAFKYMRRGVSTGRIVREYLFVMLYVLTFVVFVAISQGAEWSLQIDELAGQYTAFSHAHILSAIVFLVLFLLSAFLIWLRGRRMPPLLLVLCMCMLVIGIVLSVASVVQLSGGEDPGSGSTGRDNAPHEALHWLAALYPVMNIVLAFGMFGKLAMQEAKLAPQRTYRNPALDKLNKLMARRQPLWVMALLLPLFAVVTAVLVLFGQDPDSLVKVFTQTSTWNFSQMTHPPYLGHEGHYLCTVAACGHPRVVRPARLGRRRGNEIIVNRQLMVANAWEEWLQQRAPRLHRVVRRAYDRRGLPLSRHITTPWHSDAVYLMMKPVEWFFVVTLYLFCTDPEQRIKRQYPR